MSISYKSVILALLPGSIMLALFYSLAVHMHHSLGSWPQSIGERGFSPALLLHSTVAVQLHVALVLSLFVVPIPAIMCLLSERWRHLAVYLVLYAAAVLFGFFLTLFAAPAGFLYWWRD